MAGPLFIFPLFFASCLSALIRPYYGLIGFYAFVFLEPEWNWRWSISQDWNFQRYIGICLIAGALLHGFRGNHFNGWYGRATACLLGFIFLAWISAQQSIAPELTEFYLSVLTKVVIVAILGMRLVDSSHKALGLLWVIVICQGYNALRINEQYFIDGYSLYAMRDWGFKGDNNLYSIFTVPAMAAAIGLAIHSQTMWQRGLAALIAALQLHQLMLLESRGCMLGGILMVVCVLWLMPKTRFNVQISLAAAVVAAVLAGPPVVREFASAFAEEGQRDSSADSRFLIWKAGFEITRQHPWLGVGPYAGQAEVPKFVPEFSNKQYKGLHNLFFEISTGCGLPATVLYFSFFIIPWWRAIRTYRLEKEHMDQTTAAGLLALSAGLPGYFLSSMFSSGALLESSYILAICGAASLRIFEQQEHAESESEIAYEDVLDERLPA